MVAIGDRIELVSTPRSPHTPAPGAQGTVTNLTAHYGEEQVWVEWDGWHTKLSFLDPRCDTWRSV